METNSHPSGLIVRVVGEAGISNVAVLERELTKILVLRPPLVVFDLSGLDFIASLGMGALMSFRQGLVRNGGMVRVAAAQPAVLTCSPPGAHAGPRSGLHQSADARRKTHQKSPESKITHDENL